MKKWELAVLAGIVFCFGAAVSGQVRPQRQQGEPGSRVPVQPFHGGLRRGLPERAAELFQRARHLRPDRGRRPRRGGSTASRPGRPSGRCVDPDAFGCGGRGRRQLRRVHDDRGRNPQHRRLVRAGGEYGLSVTCSPNPGCTASPTILCLNNDRFAVTSMWRTDWGSGSGAGVKLTGDTGYFWFFDAANVELVTKVLNGCVLTNAYWVFAGGLTNVGVVLTVVDTQTGTPAYYVNSAGPAFQPIQDTKALSTCP